MTWSGAGVAAGVVAANALALQGLGLWTSKDVERIARLQAANLCRCCPEHRAWEHKHNRHRVEWEFPDDWDAEAG